MKYLAVFLILSFVLQSSHALYPASSKAVIIRIDDIQDYNHTSPYLLTEEMVLQHQIDSRVPSLLAVIASDFGNEPKLIDQIKAGLDRKIFTIGVHGWTHTPYVGMSLSMQTANMQYAKDRLQAIFGIQVLTFVPPYDNYDDATIQAMKNNQLTMISSADYLGDIPREQDGIMYIPDTVTTANVVNQSVWEPVPLDSITGQIRNSWDSYGIAIAVIHPQEFIDNSTGKELWSNYLSMIDWIQANGGTIIRPEPPTPSTEYAFDPLQLSIGILIGIVSTSLVYVAVTKKQRKASIGRTREHQTGSAVLA